MSATTAGTEIDPAGPANDTEDPDGASMLTRAMTGPDPAAVSRPAWRLRRGLQRRVRPGPNGERIYRL